MSFPTFSARLKKQHDICHDAMQNFPFSDIVFEDSRHLGSMQQVPNLRSQLGVQLLHLLLFGPAPLLLENEASPVSCSCLGSNMATMESLPTAGKVATRQRATSHCAGPAWLPWNRHR